MSFFRYERNERRGKTWKSLLFMEEAVGNWLVRDYRRRALRRAGICAYRAFAEKYPEWQEQLFDDHFLTHRAAELLESYIEGPASDPVALVHAWANQWGWRAETRVRLVADLTPVAAEFLRMLEAELDPTWVAAKAPLHHHLGLHPVVLGQPRTCVNS